MRSERRWRAGLGMVALVGLLAWPVAAWSQPAGAPGRGLMRGVEPVRSEIRATNEEWMVIGPKLQRIMRLRQSLDADLWNPERELLPGVPQDAFAPPGVVAPPPPRDTPGPGNAGAGTADGPRSERSAEEEDAASRARLQQAVRAESARAQEPRRGQNARRGQGADRAASARDVVDDTPPPPPEDNARRGGIIDRLLGRSQPNPGNSFGQPGEVRPAAPPGGGGQRGMGRMDEIGQARAELYSVLYDPGASLEEIQAKVAGLRAARQKVRDEFDAAQKDLLLLLTEDQEAILVSLGYLD